MAEAKPVGVGHGRRRWIRRAFVATPVLLLAGSLTVALSDTASAPVGAIGLTTAEAAPTTAPQPYTTITAPGYAVPGGGRVESATTVSASAAEIPDLALAAYQRAAVVINASDKSCRLTWHLIAAIGRVESNHGRFGGSTITASGVVRPAIIGARLDGRNGTTRIKDTDAGQLDGDQRFDRAVGPMQFIPSTWSFVGVDADGDGKRNPQDIEDAALSTAVYLCAGKGDLSTETDQRRAVYRYNHSSRYVDLVLAIADAYATGDSWELPRDATPVLTRPAPEPKPAPAKNNPGSQQGDQHQGQGNGHQGNGHQGNGNGNQQPGTAPDPDSNEPDATQPDAGAPTEPTEPTEPGGDATQPEPPAPDPEPEPEPEPEPDPDQLADEATALCAELGFVKDAAQPDNGFDVCVEVALKAATDKDGVPTLPTPEELLALLAERGIVPPGTKP